MQSLESEERALLYASNISLILDLDQDNISQVNNYSLVWNNEETNKINITEEVHAAMKNWNTTVQILLQDKHAQILSQIDLHDLSLKITPHSIGENIEIISRDTAIDITNYNNF